MTRRRRRASRSTSTSSTCWRPSSAASATTRRAAATSSTATSTTRWEGAAPGDRVTATAGDPLRAGAAELERGAWEPARAAFEAAVALEASPAAWEGLSWAAWWLEDGAAAIDAREHAYRGFRQAADQHGAARMALWLFNDHVEFRRAYAVAGGWLERAARILDDLEPAPEHGWLAAMQAYAELNSDPAAAQALGARARESGRRCGLVSLEMLGLATEGRALVAAGDVGAGCAASTRPPRRRSRGSSRTTRAWAGPAAT